MADLETEGVDQYAQLRKSLEMQSIARGSTNHVKNVRVVNINRPIQRRKMSFKAKVQAIGAIVVISIVAGAILSLSARFIGTL